jgi:hypothetical protein
LLLSQFTLQQEGRDVDEFRLLTIPTALEAGEHCSSRPSTCN